MSQSQDTALKSWRFTCQLAYVLVNGKQIANGEVDLVVKCEAGKSPAFASRSRHVDQPTAGRHTLMVYVSKEADPKISLSLDDFLMSTETVPSPAPIRYSAQRRRLLIKGSSRLASTPVHDFRFSKGHDLLDTIRRLNRIGIICADDDKDLTDVPRPQPSSVSGSETTSPGFILSPEMMKDGRVMSPLQRRPDGSTPPFGLIQVPNSRRSTSSLSRHESVASQLSQKSQLMLPPRRELNFTSKPPVAVGTQAGQSTAQLDSIPPVLPLRTPTPTMASIPVRAPETTLRNGTAPRGLASEKRLQRVDSIADSDISSSQPAKRRRVSQPPRRKRDFQADTALEVTDSQISLAQTRATSNSADAFGQVSQTQSASQPEPVVPDARVQVNKENELNVAAADHFRGGNMRQTLIWEELRDALIKNVDAAEDDDGALESLVEAYQTDLILQLARGSISSL